MTTLARVLVLIVGLQHLGFLILEAFLWKTEIGRQVFRTKPDFAEATAPMMKNQGLYNGFLAAGLIWSLIPIGLSTEAPRSIAIFFLVCVIVAGVVGAVTVNRRIFAIQSVPAIAGLAAVLLA